MTIESLFGRINADGNVDVLDRESGEAVTRLLNVPGSAGIYPVGRDMSALYEHPAGIVLTRDDAEKIGLQIEA
jgi:hypothetical protein